MTDKTMDCGSVSRADVETMIRALAGEREHDYQGGCPVPGSIDARDPDCPVCQAMVRASADLATECRSVAQARIDKVLKHIEDEMKIARSSNWNAERHYYLDPIKEMLAGEAPTTEQESTGE